jgi:hypothetical protein
MLAPLFKYNFHCTGLHFMELYFNLLWHCLSLQLFHCADISIEIPNVFAIRTRHDIAEILLKLALITNQSLNFENTKSWEQKRWRSNWREFINTNIPRPYIFCTYRYIYLQHLKLIFSLFFQGITSHNTYRTGILLYITENSSRMCFVCRLEYQGTN